MEKQSTEAQRPRGKRSLLCQCFAQVFLLQPCGFWLAVIGCFFCSLCSGSQQWQIWEVDNIPGIPKVSLGIWNLCYLELLYGGRYSKVRCEKLSLQDSSMPTEVLLAQLLMSFSLVVQALAMGLFLWAWGIAALSKGQRSLGVSLAKTAVFLNFTSGIITLVPLSWNIALVDKREALEFPERFSLPRFPREQQIGQAMYLGLISVAFQMMAGLLKFCQKCRRYNRRNSLTLVPVGPDPLNGEVSSRLSSGSLFSLTDPSLTVASESHFPSSPQPSIAPVYLSRPRLSSPTASGSHISPPLASPPLHLHNLSFSSLSESHSPPLSPGASPIRRSSLILSSVTLSELPNPSPDCSPLLLPTLDPSSPTQRSFLSSSPIPPPHLSPGESPSKPANLRVPSPTPRELPHCPRLCSPIRSPLPAQRDFSASPPPESSPGGLTKIDI